MSYVADAGIHLAFHKDSRERRWPKGVRTLLSGNPILSLWR